MYKDSFPGSGNVLFLGLGSGYTAVQFVKIHEGIYVCYMDLALCSLPQWVSKAMERIHTEKKLVKKQREYLIKCFVSSDIRRKQNISCFKDFSRESLGEHIVYNTANSTHHIPSPPHLFKINTKHFTGMFLYVSQWKPMASRPSLVKTLRK